MRIDYSDCKLKNLSSEDLLFRLQKLVQTERKITHSILECINEIDLRKLHLARGYASLFDFLTLSLGYTPASAQRRIDGARLLRQIPEVAEKIESGEINLSQVSLLQKSIRQFQANTNEKVSVSYKKELLEKIANQNFKSSEVMLAKELNLPLPTQTEKTQHHKDESQSVTLHFSKEEMIILEQVKNLKSNATGSLDLKSLILYLAKKELGKYKKQKNSIQFSDELSIPYNNQIIIHNKNKPEPELKKELNSKVTVNSQQELQKQKVCSLFFEAESQIPNIESEVKSTRKSALTLNQKPVPRGIYNQIIRPEACCEFKDSKTQRICGSKLFLQVDHIKPRWAFRFEVSEINSKNFNNIQFGSDSSIKTVRYSSGDALGKETEINSLQNLRVLCANHNKYRYMQQFLRVK